MNAGKYDTQVIFEMKQTTQDPRFGTQVVTWVPVSTEGSPPIPVKDWSEFKPVLPSRSEAVRQGLSVARDQIKLCIRWRAGITSAMRVRHVESNLVYEIVGGPAEVGRRQELEMMLEKFTTTGTVV